MKRRIVFSIALIALAVWALAQAPANPAGLAALMPPGPLLVLEAKDFGALVRDWNGSQEKQSWLKSDNYEVFSRSRLFLRLSGARDEFAAAAGIPPDMNLVESVAGSESALALYDIGNLQFLYITKLPSARALETALWRTRSSYETRNAAGLAYFVRIEPASHRVAAFAAAKDYLLLATREDLIAGALTRLAGQPGATVTTERWYAESVRAAHQAGDLRLVLNLADLVRSPYFRSYWIQRNVSDIRQFGAGIADVFRSAPEIREERVLLRFDQPDAPDRTAKLAFTAPADAGLARTWARPTAAAALDLLEKKVFAPGPSAPTGSRFAPAVTSSGIAGTEADLETRIDEAPLETAIGSAVPDAARKLIESATLEGMMHIGTSREVPGGVFVNIDSAVVLLASADWDAAAVRTAFAAGPLDRIAAEAHGPVLVVATTPELAHKVLAAVPAQPNTASSYEAAFHHASERPRFLKMMRLVDNASEPRQAGGDQREPRFFSENLGSLSGVLGSVSSASIAARDTGPAVFETVLYRFGQ